MRSVSLRLQSLNQKTLTDDHGCPITESFTRIRFLIYLLIVPWQDKGILDGFCKWRHLLSLGQYMLQDNGISKDNLNLSSRKRSRMQIRLESLCIKRKGQKKSVVKDSVCIGAIRERFFDLRPVAVGSQDELWQGLSIVIF